MKKISILVVILIMNFTSHAQPQFTGWLASFNSFKVGKKTSIHFDAQFRSTDEFKQTQTVLLRPGFNFHLNKKWTLTAGYAIIFNRAVVGNANDLVPEHRIWEQALYSHKIKRVYISHRVRLEQRFIGKTRVTPGNDIEVAGYLGSHRIRYFIRNILPLQKQAAFTKGFFAAVQNEVFINIAGINNANGETFDQNRLYIATGYRLGPKADLELGYMNQYVNRRGKAFTNNHIVQVAGYLRL
jgi:long-subunit fatty acid transport protein